MTQLLTMLCDDVLLPVLEKATYVRKFTRMFIALWELKSVHHCRKASS